MRKLIFFNMMTLDGFFEGPKASLEWHQTDEEFQEFAIQQLKEAELLLFGRKTYEMMAGFWPSKVALDTDPDTADLMNTIPKVVFSRTIPEAGWNNTTLVTSSRAAEITRLKGLPGKNMFLFGSASLAAELIQHGLVDEFRIMLNPVVLGRGEPLFKEVRHPMQLKLVKTRTFTNGNVLLYYTPQEQNLQEF